MALYSQKLKFWLCGNGSKIPRNQEYVQYKKILKYPILVDARVVNGDIIFNRGQVKLVPNLASLHSPLSELVSTLDFTVNSLRNSKVINSNKVNAGNKLKAIELVLKNQGRLKDVQEVTQTVEDKSLTDLLAELNKE